MAPSTRSKTHRPDDRAESAINHVPSHLRFWIVAGVMLLLDLWSKHWAFENLSPEGSEPFITGVIDLHRSLNTGAVFGSFTGQVSLFIVASLFALAFVFYLFVRSLRAHRVTHVALGMVVAGALGNLYDRAVNEADVVRFRSRDGGEVTELIGTIVHESEGMLEVGVWPQGTDPRSIPRSDAQVRRQGVVRDFIRFVPKFPAWVPRLGGGDVWPWVFNVADASLVCGVVVLLLSSWFDRRSRERQ